MAEPIDISIPVIPNTKETVNCFYAPFAKAVPVKEGHFVGDTTLGGSVNFKNLFLNPHGNGTHTECVGHIVKEKIFINKVLKCSHFIAKLITIGTVDFRGDLVLDHQEICKSVSQGEVKALIIRTTPNPKSKTEKHYSGTNPPYLNPKSTKYLVDCGIEHLLIDLPSVDREEDEGKLENHKLFWNLPIEINDTRTITELIYVPENIPDGYFLLNLQVPNIALDACPSKPLIYKLKPQD